MVQVNEQCAGGKGRMGGGKDNFRLGRRGGGKQPNPGSRGSRRVGLQTRLEAFRQAGARTLRRASPPTFQFLAVAIHDADIDRPFPACQCEFSCNIMQSRITVGISVYTQNPQMSEMGMLRQLNPVGGRETRFQSLRGDIPKGKEEDCKPQWVQDFGRTLVAQGQRQIAIQPFNREKKYAYSWTPCSGAPVCAHSPGRLE